VDDPALRPLAEWVAETQVARATASHEARELAWERGAVVRAEDGRVVEYGAVTIALANARDRRERLALDAARARVVGAELAPLRRERLARERDALLALEVAATPRRPSAGWRAWTWARWTPRAPRCSPTPRRCGTTCSPRSRGAGLTSPRAS
jgi:hypothetical protein